MMSMPGTEPQPQPMSTGAKFLGGAVLWLFAAFTFCVLPITVMASDGCNEGDTQPICSLAVQQAVVAIPMLTAPTAAILGTWGFCSRRGVGLIAWMGAMLLLIGAWAAVKAITE
ncbi:hypothetical protein ACH427_06650 [Streptomyces sp. NPDC020379]|uniref:hypothetical protein n=1 Tax=Streptomyces sp. NPDC020379 TaxID=3365071 RepID=UPI0037A1F35F